MHACFRYPPFFDEDITNTYKKIVSGRFVFPTYFPVTARDLVGKLLQVTQPEGACLAHFPCLHSTGRTVFCNMQVQVDLSKRYGNLSGGVADIKTHAWFRSLDWDGCLARKLPPPIKYVDGTVQTDVCCAAVIQPILLAMLHNSG